MGRVMKRRELMFFKSLAFCIVMAIGLSSCNIFNPTEKVNASDDDAKALTYEGYLRYQKSEFSEARKYFEKAIMADSSYSEAWFGLAKTVLNQQKGLSIFDLLSYAKPVDGESSADAFLNMDDDVAKDLKVKIDSVLHYLIPFIDRDTSGRTDKRIQLKDFANSYSILQMTKLALTVRDVRLNLAALFPTDYANGTMNVNWSAIDTLERELLIETVETLAAAAVTLNSDPETTQMIIKEYVPGADTLSEDTLKLATEIFSNQIISMNEKIQNTEERTSVFLLVGNHHDDDGDGCVDEEVFDELDNDGDGESDDDLRENNTTHRYMMEAFGKPGIEPIMVKEAVFIDHYQGLDIDGNGITSENDSDEWEFAVPNVIDRYATSNAKFRFADKIRFVGLSGNGPWSQDVIDSLIARKELIRNDTDINHITYNLADRQRMVGGCWLNYDQIRFIKWLEGRGE